MQTVASRRDRFPESSQGSGSVRPESNALFLINGPLATSNFKAVGPRDPNPQSRVPIS